MELGENLNEYELCYWKNEIVLMRLKGLIEFANDIHVTGNISYLKDKRDYHGRYNIKSYEKVPK